MCVIATCNEYSRTCSTGAIPIWGNDKNRAGLRTLVSLGELLLGFTRPSEKDALLGIVLYEGGGVATRGKDEMGLVGNAATISCFNVGHWLAQKQSILAPEMRCGGQC